MKARLCILAGCVGIIVSGCASGGASSQPAPPRLASLPLGMVTQSHGNLAERMLAAHNRERAELGVGPLVWDPNLAASAARYGPALASSGGLAHASAEIRQGQGENLWMGTRGAFSLERMVADWASEKSLFIPGVFPNVSRSGNWSEVGHYTQMVWPETTHVGCAIHQSMSSDYLICRYLPPGNVQGRPVP